MARNPKSSSKEKTPTKPEGPSIGNVESDEQPTFRYLIKGERVRRDGAYFELLLARVVLEPGEMKEFDQLWPRGTQALAGLNLRHLSKQSVKDIAELVNSVGGEFTERLGARTRDLLIWVGAFWEITKVYGSFRQYVRSFDTDGPEALIDDLSKRLSGLSPKFLVDFLRESGEKIPSLAQFEQVEDKPRRQGGGGRTRGPGRRRGRGQNRGRSREDNGSQQQQQQQQQAKTDGGSKAPDPKSEGNAKEKSAGESGGGNRQRRGRRGFFRNRRGRGKKGQPPKQQASE